MNKVKLFFIFLTIFFAGVLLLPKISWAATTYYIDYDGGVDTNNGTTKLTPWKHSPGMAGFSGSYSHSNGDIFVFKGGVTWTVSSGNIINIANSGSAGNPDQYTVDKTWYVGSAWDYPVFDGNALGNYGIYVFNKSNLIFDSLKLVNIGETVNGSGQGLVIYGGNVSNIEIKNSFFDTNGVNHLYYSPTVGSHFYFHDNHIKNGGRIPIGQGKNTLDDIRLYNNLFEGPGTYNLHNYHGDGFMIGADSGGLITNLYVYNNKFYGDWSQGATAAIYLNGTGNGVAAQDSINGAWIYNNLIVPENSTCSTTFSPGAITAYNGKFYNLYIYNNTISGDACPSSRFGGINLVTVVNAFVENNILSTLANAILVDVSASNVTIDYNQYYNITYRLVYDSIHKQSIRNCSDFANYFGTGLGGSQAYCNVGDPKFVALPSGGIAGSGDWRVQSDSPAIDHGASFSSIFTSDFSITARPQGSAWDIGAYEYVGAAPPPDTTPPQAPTGVMVN